MPRIRKAPDFESWRAQIAVAIGRSLLPAMRARIPSKTLRGALTLRRSGKKNEQVSLYVPHYWAPYYHDGRPELSGPTRNGRRYFVWFRDPSYDPRPAVVERYASWRPLTKEEFEFGLEANKTLGGSIYSMAFMVFTTRIPPLPPHRFFDGGRSVLDQTDAAQKALAIFDSLVAKEAKAISQTSRITARLG